jgi:hypothetical protein
LAGCSEANADLAMNEIKRALRGKWNVTGFLVLFAQTVFS